MILFFIGNMFECDLTLCQQILDESLEKHPNGAFFLFFKGRMHFVQVNIMQDCAFLKIQTPKYFFAGRNG